jgi:hypothetical protein
MANIALVLSTAKGHMMTHMLSTMDFSLLPDLVPDTDTAHVLDMVPSQAEYHSQHHIPHHPHPVLDSQARMALIPVILEECQSLFIQQRILLMVFRCRLVQLMVRCP